MQPVHVAAGLGGADRELLSICLGVFDDATLARQAKAVVHGAAKIADRAGISVVVDGVELAAKVEDAADRWRSDSKLTDRHLRTILWARLQSALDVEPGLTHSVRGCQRLADDLVVSALKGQRGDDTWNRVAKVARRGLSTVRQAAGWTESRKEEGRHKAAVPETLGALVAPLVTEMVANAMAKSSGMPQEDKERFIAEAAARLSEEERRSILNEVGDQDFEGALTKWLATSSAYGSVGLAVGASGFAPYVLAAQASAFIPLVSGPALVSFLSVLTNPVVVVAAIAALAHRFAGNAKQQAAAKIAAHLIALLACDGVRRTRRAVEELVASFDTIPELPEDTFGGRHEGAAYRTHWRELCAEVPLQASAARPEIADDWDRIDINRDSVGIGALSVGDLVYSLSAIDPQVVAAADFSSREEIASSFDFAAYVLARVSDRWNAQDSFSGLVDSQKGFVMEQLVATKLAAEGHVVEFPDTANQPGWDLIVDSRPFQVKCLADSGGLAEHFERYPDIPVLVNSDLIDDYDAWPAEWRDSVFFVDGHTNELLSQVTERSYLEAMDFAANDVPEIALVYVAARQAWKLKSGEVTASQAASHLLIEGSTRAGLAVGGGIVGTSIGLLVLGPAGALIGGAFAPVFAQAGAGRLVVRVKEATGLESEEDKEIDRRSDEFLSTVRKAIDDKLEVLRIKYRLVGGGVAGEYVRYRLADDGRHLRESLHELSRLEQDRRDVRSRAISILRVALRSVHSSHYQRPLRALLRAMEA